MKNIKNLCFLAAIVLFTACYNPNSSTSQEKSDETTATEHGAGGHSKGEHGSGEHGAAHDEAKPAATHSSESGNATDTTMHGGEKMHTDSAQHK